MAGHEGEPVGESVYFGTRPWCRLQPDPDEEVLAEAELRFF